MKVVNASYKDDNMFILVDMMSKLSISISILAESSCVITFWSIADEYPCPRNTLLKSDVTRRDHVVPLSWITGILVHALSISFAMAQTSHNSEIYNIGCMRSSNAWASDVWALTAYKETYFVAYLPSPNPAMTML